MIGEGELLFLSPSFGTVHPGGIEYAARMAGRALAEISGGRGRLVTYQDSSTAGVELGVWREVQACAGSKLRAGLTCGRWGRRFTEIHCFHLGLRRLLPLVARRGARVFQWLMGLEAWQPLGLAGLLRRRAVFLSISRHTWERFAAANPAAADAPHAVVPLGWGGPLAEDGIPEFERGLVAMCGRLAGPEREKGFDEVLASWPAVLRGRPDARLVIVGDGLDRGRLEALAARGGVSGVVAFAGEVSEERKAEILSRCQVFALPSRKEGFGLVYVEAMRFGRPCVIGAADAAVEVARPGHEALAVDARKPEAIAEAILALLNDRDLYRRCAASARSRAATYLTEAHFAARLREARRTFLETQ